VCFKAVAKANGVQRMEDRLVASLHANCGNTGTAPVRIQSFEVSKLPYIDTQTDMRSAPLLSSGGWPNGCTVNGDSRTCADLARPTADSVLFAQACADGVGANTNRIIPVAGGVVGTPTTPIADPHSLGLEARGRTFRAGRHGRPQAPERRRGVISLSRGGATLRGAAAFAPVPTRAAP
jgi:glycerophosphoryl diester phosphodiesterase